MSKNHDFCDAEIQYVQIQFWYTISYSTELVLNLLALLFNASAVLEQICRRENLGRICQVLVIV